MIVLQVILGEIPDRIIPCVKSVEEFSRRNSVIYNKVLAIESCDIQIKDIKTGVQAFDEYAYNRAVSEIIRIDFCSTHKNVLYCDWDILLKHDFEIPQRETFGSIPDALYFNGDNTDRYVDIRKNLKKSYHAGECILAKYLWPVMEREKCNHFNQNTYKHLFEFNNQININGCYDYTKSFQ